MLTFIEVHSLSFAALSSSLREGAGKGFHHSSGYSLKSYVTGDFHRPYEALRISAYTIQRTTLPQSALRADSSLREGAGNGFHHSSGYSLTSGVAGDFHRPYGGPAPFIRLLAEIPDFGRFTSPRRADTVQLYSCLKAFPSVHLFLD